MSKIFSAGMLSAVAALSLLASVSVLLKQAVSAPVPPLEVVLRPGTTVISNYVPRISFDQRYEVSFRNNKGIVDIEQGDAGTRCKASRQMIARLTRESGTFYLSDEGGQSELCAVVTGGTATMEIKQLPLTLQ